MPVVQALRQNNAPVHCGRMLAHLHCGKTLASFTVAMHRPDAPLSFPVPLSPIPDAPLSFPDLIGESIVTLVPVSGVVDPPVKPWDDENRGFGMTGGVLSFPVPLSPIPVPHSSFPDAPLSFPDAPLSFPDLIGESIVTLVPVSGVVDPPVKPWDDGSYWRGMTKTKALG